MKYETKPTNGNLNLMISINKIQELLRPIQSMNMNHTIRALKKVGEHSFEISEDFGQIEFVKLYEADLLNLLEIETRKKTDPSEKLRVELKKDEFGHWTQDMGVFK